MSCLALLAIYLCEMMITWQDCIAPLCDFHSTAVVNAVFPDRITCYFPSQTLRYRMIRNAGFQQSRDDKAVTKYTGRGVLFWFPLFMEITLTLAESLKAGSHLYVRQSFSRKKCYTQAPGVSLLDLR